MTTAMKTMCTRAVASLLLCLAATTAALAQARIEEQIRDLESKNVMTDRIVKRDPKTRRVGMETKNFHFYSQGGTVANALREAFEALQEKLYDDSTEEERLQKFREHFPDFSKEYPAKELFVWHHVLTGSCKAGRESFCRDNGINIDKDTFTIHEFISLTKNSYGGETIKKLIEN